MAEAVDDLAAIVAGRRFVVVGVGNTERGDDGIGNYLLSKLSTRNKIDCGPMPENFISKIHGFHPEVIVIVDAVDFGGKPGQVMISPAENAGSSSISTHSLPLSLLCRFFPDSDVYLLGIQPMDFNKLSSVVRSAADSLSEKLNLFLE